MKENVPVLLLKKLSLLPYQEVRIELSNELSKEIIDLSIKKHNNKILILVPDNTLEEAPSIKDLPNMGILTYIKSSIELPNGNYRVVIQGLNRVEVINYDNYIDNESILISTVKMLYIKNEETTEAIVLKRKLINLIKNYIKLNPNSSNSILSKLNNEEDLDTITDLIVPFINIETTKKNDYIAEFNEIKRARLLVEDLNIELEVLKLNNKLEKDIRNDLEKDQKEYILKTKIDKLNQELGFTNTKENEVNNYKEIIKELNSPIYIKDKLESELKKYSFTPDNSPDSSIIRKYIDTLINLPFNLSKEELNENIIIKSLDKTHYGMNEIKHRIVEYAKLKSKNKDLESPILCLIGPPGTGKTTLAMSISKSLKREFFKINVGGLNDSSELTGHRRTYLGAAPGKLISGIIKSNTNNPIILIDEVDKMVKDYKGDPASVLLDILDVNQNNTFVDNYIEEAYDLSNSMFILTANDEELIPSPLKDRLEIIHTGSYTVYDKLNIAKDYLIPKIFKKYNTKSKKISDEVILYIINNYTLESGVRELERVLDKLIRDIIINKISLAKITIEYSNKLLGNTLYGEKINNNNIGTVNILGVSPLGGKVITVQSLVVPDKENVIITGNVGDITKDNIMVTISYLKAANYIKQTDLKNKLLHINFNQDIKLNGGSGSLGVAVSILSLIKHKKINSNIAFTGKLDLYGNILKVSSLKEKIITSYNSNIKTIYLPKEHKEDKLDIPDFVLKDIKLIFVETFEDVYKSLFK